MIRLLSTSQAASQDAAIFTIASLMKWDLAGVRRSFARHQGGHPCGAYHAPPGHHDPAPPPPFFHPARVRGYSIAFATRKGKASVLQAHIDCTHPSGSHERVAGIIGESLTALHMREDLMSTQPGC